MYSLDRDKMNTPYRILKELDEVDNIIEIIDESENIDKNYILAYKKQIKDIINPEIICQIPQNAAIIAIPPSPLKNVKIRKI